MCAMETAASASIIEVITDYINATYANLELPHVEVDAKEADNLLHDINAAIARLKTGLPPVLA